jgi:hypothetical protein
MLASAAQARAGFTLFNTGVALDGDPLSVGAIDPHWSIVAGPGITTPVPAIVVNDQHLGAYFQDAHSQWIWVDASGFGGGSNTTYTFRLTFDLTGFDLATAKITGDWGVDNNGQILLNGSIPAIPKGDGQAILKGSPTENFGQFHHFSITGGFVSGLNTLDFVVTNTDGPGALNVTNLVGTADAATPSAVPEPASMTIFASGALCLLGYAWGRRRAICA